MPSERRNSGSWDGWLWKYALPLLAVFVLVLIALDSRELIRAANNEGEPGTFTSARADCRGRGGCTYYGRFVSNDGITTLKDVFIDGGVDEVGVSVEAQYFEGSRTDKVYESDSHDWIWASILFLGSLLYLAGWGWVAVRP